VQKLISSSSIQTSQGQRTGEDGEHDGRRDWGSGDLGFLLSYAGGRGDRGDFGVLLTLEGENGRVASGGPQWRPVAASSGGGAPVHLRRWGVVERVSLGERMLLVASNCSVGAPSR
jgi:hypothetical protein